jgi:hypothetical protein
MFISGKEKNKHFNDRTGGTQGGAGKEVVLGIPERDSELRASEVSDHKGNTLKGAVCENVACDSTMSTDEDRSFKGLDKDFDHHAVNHSAGEYFRHHTTHTNSIENVWALLKRLIIGILHWVSPKHLDRCVQVMTLRCNRHDMRVVARLNDMFSCVEGRLTYKDLKA